MSPAADAWLEAVSRVRADIAAEVRDEAFELFVVEAARSRLVDRRGHGRLHLRCGETLEGDLGAGGRAGVDGEDAVEGQVRLVDSTGRSWLVPVSSVVTLVGTRPVVRPEGTSAGVSLGSWLRETWTLGIPVHVVTMHGQRLRGHLAQIGADHVDLRADGSVVTVAIGAVDAWSRG